MDVRRSEVDMDPRDLAEELFGPEPEEDPPDWKYSMPSPPFPWEEGVDGP